MHKAKAVIITCMDFRFHDKIQDFLNNQGYLGHCDEIVIAGASRDFIKPVEADDGKYVWKQLGLSLKLHEPEEIIIIDHQDCGGYAQDGTIPGGLKMEDDLHKHTDYLQKLQKKLVKECPGKKISFYYAELQGEIRKVNF